MSFPDVQDFPDILKWSLRFSGYSRYFGLSGQDFMSLLDIPDWICKVFRIFRTGPVRFSRFSRYSGQDLMSFPDIPDIPDFLDIPDLVS